MFLVSTLSQLDVSFNVHSQHLKFETPIAIGACQIFIEDGWLGYTIGLP